MHIAATRRTGSARRLVAAGLAAATASCQDNLRPNPPADAPPVAVTYVCGNDFELQNLDSIALITGYTVAGTKERGELVLPPRAGEGTPSTTRLTTLRSGTLQVAYRNEEIASAGNAGVDCPSPSPQEPQATAGEWSAPLEWPVVAVHLHLLPSGQVLSWGRIGEPQVWDPLTGGFTAAASASMLFCSGHAFLPDGRLLVTGGHLGDNRGLPDANIFDPATRGWTALAPMSRGRWYPSSTTLSDGEVLTLAGRDQQGEEVETPEVWTGSGWRRLTSAARALPYYPRAFVAPNGLVFYAGELAQTSYLDPEGTGAWTPVASSKYGRRDYGSAVMYRPGRVLIVGGSDPPDGPPTSTAEVIDLTSAAPGWRYTGSMAYPRRQFNATLLADGSVLATGGTSTEGFSDPSGAVRFAELWDPASEVWSLLAGNRVSRVYHSTALLLPDGRVLHSGSGDGVGLPRELTAEIFSPPYLFRGPRPSIEAAPKAVGYAEQFFVATGDAPRVVRATLVRLGSVTHGFDQNQRFYELVFQRVAGGLTMTAPATGSLAPPGHYMLFIFDRNGVPSKASIVRFGD